MWPAVWPGVRRQRTWMAPNCGGGAGGPVRAGGPGAPSPPLPGARAHPQLLAVRQPARQREDALVRAQHRQPGTQPRQLRVSPRVVPAGGRAGGGRVRSGWDKVASSCLPAPRRRSPVMVGGQHSGQRHPLPAHDLQQLKGTGVTITQTVPVAHSLHIGIRRAHCPRPARAPVSAGERGPSGR